MAKVILKAQDLDGYLKAEDRDTLEGMNEMFSRALELFRTLSEPSRAARHDSARADLIRLFDEMGHAMQKIVAREPRVNVYSFSTPREVHGEASRLIAKLRDAQDPGRG